MSFTIHCPKCGMALTASEENVGKSAQCPGCTTLFTVQAPVGHAQPSDVGYASATGGSQPARTWQNLASDRLKAPAIALLVIGILGALLDLYQMVSIALGVGMAQQPPGQIDPQMQQVLEMVAKLSGPVGIILCVISLLLAVLIIWGAIQMMQVGSYGLAMTAAILAIIPCTSPCCILTTPFGIWALVVLNKPEVREAFG